MQLPAWLSFNVRANYVKLLVLSGCITSLYFFYTYYSDHTPLLRQRTWVACSPEAYADGQWTYEPKTNATKMTNSQDSIAFSGFTGCASSREFYWHLAADREDQYDRFPKAHSYRWDPRSDCNIHKMDPEAMLRDMVEQGGWLLIGDSVTEQHFFSLSCTLHPHVIATPDYNAGIPISRSHPQNLYLAPTSPLFHRLQFPAGFDPARTPLVTFQRVDIMFSLPELSDLYASIHDPDPDFKLFSNGEIYTQPPKQYLDLFTAPLPDANYGTMVVSTAGHWSTIHFAGLLKPGDKASHEGIDDVIALFDEAMKKWSDTVQRTMYEEQHRDGGVQRAGMNKPSQRQVVVRAYLPGHEECLKYREPWDYIHPFDWGEWNWPYIEQFNHIFEGILSTHSHPNIHFLPIDRPGRLRPDGHVTGDCLHIMVGAGIIEGWSHYIWHYISRELRGEELL